MGQTWMRSDEMMGVEGLTLVDHEAAASGYGLSRLPESSLVFCRSATWVWRRAWTTTPVSLCCPAAARLNV